MEIKDLRTLLFLAAKSYIGRGALSTDFKNSVKWEPAFTNSDRLYALMGQAADKDHPLIAMDNWTDAGDEPFRRVMRSEKTAVGMIEEMKIGNLTIDDFPATKAFLGDQSS